MRIMARVANSGSAHAVRVSTDGRSQAITIAPRQSGRGSSVNGGELLFLALATCYCNDLHREAGARGIALRAVEVEVTGEFGGPGEPALGIEYRVRVETDAPDDRVARLLEDTDEVAEIHNTLREGCPVRFAGRLLPSTPAGGPDGEG